MQQSQQNNNQIKILDTEQFLTQLKLLNISEEFRNTCHFLVQNSIQQGAMLQNFTLAVATMLNSSEEKNFNVTDEKINEVQDKVNVSLSEIENGFQVKLVPVKKLKTNII